MKTNTRQRNTSKTRAPKVAEPKYVFCKDCVYCEPFALGKGDPCYYGQAICRHEKARYLNLVDGTLHPILCGQMRNEGVPGKWQPPCGPSGKLFIHV